MEELEGGKKEEEKKKRVTSLKSHSHVCHFPQVVSSQVDHFSLICPGLPAS